LFGAAVIGGIAGWLWKPLAGPITLIAFVIFWLAAVLNDEQALNCPRCGKMVKLGATACHHCGHATAITAGPS
jgi:hypothetical protein